MVGNYTPLIERGYIEITVSVRPLVRLSVYSSVHTFVKAVSAATGRNDFIVDTWLWHSLHFPRLPTSTSCLPCDLEMFMFAVMKTCVTVISASTGRNDFIFDMWLWHGDLYRVSPFQVYCISTSCLPCDLEFGMRGIEAMSLMEYLSFYHSLYSNIKYRLLIQLVSHEDHFFLHIYHSNTIQ